MLTNTITLACFRLDLQRKKIETEQKYKADIEAMQKHVEQVGIAIIQYNIIIIVSDLRLLFNLIQLNWSSVIFHLMTSNQILEQPQQFKDCTFWSFSALWQ